MLRHALALCLACGGLILGIMLPHGVVAAATIAPSMACAPTGCCCLSDAAHEGARCPMAGVMGSCGLRSAPASPAATQAAFAAGGLPPAARSATSEPVPSPAVTPTPPGPDFRLLAGGLDPATPPPEAARAA